MSAQISAAQLTGRDNSHLQMMADGHQLVPAAAAAFATLQDAARKAGFELAIASSFRSFDRQLAIWNGKASGERPVHDDLGCEVQMHTLAPPDQLRAILRYSALPGGSRHHWGTELDVFDAAAIDPDYRVQLSPAEVASGGVFDPLHRWLDERIDTGQSCDFFRPYAADRGGVAPERWHLSFAPLSAACEQAVTAELLLESWHRAGTEEPALLLADQISANLPQIMRDYVRVAPDWCPAQYRV